MAPLWVLQNIPRNHGLKLKTWGTITETGGSTGQGAGRKHSQKSRSEEEH